MLYAGFLLITILGLISHILHVICNIFSQGFICDFRKIHSPRDFSQIFESFWGKYLWDGETYSTFQILGYIPCWKQVLIRCARGFDNSSENSAITRIGRSPGTAEAFLFIPLIISCRATLYQPLSVCLCVCVSVCVSQIFVRKFPSFLNKR